MNEDMGTFRIDVEVASPSRRDERLTFSSFSSTQGPSSWSTPDLCR